MTRNDFKEYCLRALGKGAVVINVTDAQVEDRVNDALQAYKEVHSDGMVEVILKRQVTSQDKTNRYIPIADDVLYVTEVYPIASRTLVGGIFDIEYQLHLNDIFDLSYAGGLTNYVQVKQYLGLLEDTIRGAPYASHSRVQGRLYLDFNWDEISVGQYILFRAYRTQDPATTNKVYDDRWLKQYATALIGMQWGNNLSLFDGVVLLGGVNVDGEKIYSKYSERAEVLMTELYERFSPPPMGSYG